ncbi:probable ubiquitin-conjugating enzyme E2 25 [Beta vulgaris subsp. vulgaris]|uniref:probable ubiquitin-conjugating enzyme E2 25 n=1 Tax=Beta vulgaris subsp. vulgaris TaxID=3555 RepID=UPI00203766BE|nr:probable ubiquitin-conjugating enzyme E2 25 [Beta vulgaris subsp. vulgaris]
MAEPSFFIRGPRHYKKKFVAEGSSSSSSSFLDTDIIEISPPPGPPPMWESKPPKQKLIVGHEIIAVENEDPDDVVVIDEKVAVNGKGKKPMLNYFPGDEVISLDGLPSSQTKEYVKGNMSPLLSSIDDDLDRLDVFYGDHQYDMQQSYIDSLNIRSGTEATIPMWPASAASKKHEVPANNSSLFGTPNYSNISSSKVDDFKSASSVKPSPYKNHMSKSASFSRSPITSRHDLPSFVEATIPMWPASAASKKHEVPANNSSLFGTPNYSNISSSKVDDFKSASFVKPSPYENHMSKSASFSRSPITSRHDLPSFVIPPMPQGSFAHSTMKSATSSSPYYPHSGGNAYNDWLPYPVHVNQNPIVTSTYLPIESLPRDSISLEDIISAKISPPSTYGQGNSSSDSILKKLELFKKFDTLGDHLGHYYDKIKTSFKPSDSWANKIADEWRMLEKDLPDTIFVRVYEARMDLLRAVMIGADGTPYHDGLFFFDVHFTSSYPTNPPLVNYHAHGLRINPNLYNCGKVCLSLLGTWSGTGVEQWRPCKSNMLQVLVSIQGLILNAEPFYNEPAYETTKNSIYCKEESRDYSETTFLLSLKTMLYTMRNPPKHFEDLVYGHFHKRAHDILEACRAYLKGVEMGSFVKGRIHGTTKTCSQLFKTNLPLYIKTLVEAFTKIGVKDCEKFLIS